MELRERDVVVVEGREEEDVLAAHLVLRVHSSHLDVVSAVGELAPLGRVEGEALAVALHKFQRKWLLGLRVIPACQSSRSRKIGADSNPRVRPRTALYLSFAMLFAA